jgi:hypothetical protein
MDDGNKSMSGEQEAREVSPKWWTPWSGVQRDVGDVQCMLQCMRNKEGWRVLWGGELGWDKAGCVQACVRS